MSWNGAIFISRYSPPNLCAPSEQPLGGESAGTNPYDHKEYKMCQAVLQEAERKSTRIRSSFSQGWFFRVEENFCLGRGSSLLGSREL